MRRYLLTLALVVLAGCEPDSPKPHPWEETLDVFMAEQGYTLDSTRETIYKNGYPLWYDQHECYRSCQYRYLGPNEIYNETKNDFFNAYNAARAKYVNEIAAKVGVNMEDKPNVVK